MYVSDLARFPNFPIVVIVLISTAVAAPRYAALFPPSLLQHDLVPNPDLDLNLDLVTDALKSAVHLDLFLTLIWGDCILVKSLREDPLIPPQSFLLPPLLSLSTYLSLQQPQTPPSTSLVDLSAVNICRFYPYLAGSLPPLFFQGSSFLGKGENRP